jgi:hypothetical protein
MPAPQGQPRTHGTRQDTFVVRLEVEGNTFGIWDKKTGGELDSDEVKYYPGGMNPAISLGGRKVPGNITLQRNYDLVQDHDKINTLYDAVGRGAVKVSQRPMDIDDNEGYGHSIIWTGKLKRVLVPDVDSESTTASLIEIEVSVDGEPRSVPR